MSSDDKGIALILLILFSPILLVIIGATLDSILGGCG